MTFRNGSPEAVEDILLSAKSRVVMWAMINANKIKTNIPFDLNKILEEGKNGRENLNVLNGNRLDKKPLTIG